MNLRNTTLLKAYAAVKLVEEMQPAARTALPAGLYSMCCAAAAAIESDAEFASAGIPVVPDAAARIPMKEAA